MQPPAHNQSSLVETLSRPLVLVLRYLFFVLTFFLGLSIAAGLFMPGQEFGRYGVLLQPGQSCVEFERELAPFNVNQVDWTLRSAEADEFDRSPANGSLCWLEIAGVSSAGVGVEALPLHDAARERVAEVLAEDRLYQPRYGSRETQLVWLLSLLMAAGALGWRLRRQQKDAAES